MLCKLSGGCAHAHQELHTLMKSSMELRHSPAGRRHWSRWLAGSKCQRWEKTLGHHHWCQGPKVSHLQQKTPPPLGGTDARSWNNSFPLEACHIALKLVLGGGRALHWTLFHTFSLSLSTYKMGSHLFTYIHHGSRSKREKI